MIEHAVEAFITRWGGGTSYGGNERANLQMFITELCTLLDLPQPDPSGGKVGDNAYVFERKLTDPTADGGQTARASDLYRRGCFILEGKDTGKQTGSSGWDAAIVKARNQSENYARLLPPEEGRPPFIVVVDVGRTFTLFAEFSRSGGYYVAFPDARRHTIRLEQLRDPDTRELLRILWLDPLSLDPTRNAGKITRALADRLATLAKSLEADGHSPEPVAAFLMRCLFTMFAEDVGLLPERSFVELLERLKPKPESFCPQLRSLWQTMNAGGFSPALDAEAGRFNGGLFADSRVIALTGPQIDQVCDQVSGNHDNIEVKLQERQGRMFADLRIGVTVVAATELQANQNVSQRGFELGNSGFIVTLEEVASLGHGRDEDVGQPIRAYRNGRNLTQSPRGAMVIDLFGLSVDEVRNRYPAIYQWLPERVKPEQDQNRDPRLQREWWLHRRSREDLRKMLTGLPRFVATVETSRHRTFQFLDAVILPDNKLVNIAIDDAGVFGILSSRLHITWALAAGSRLGIGNDPVYVKTTCFETFRFPDATPEQQTTIRTLAEQLDAHRKRQQAAHPDLTLTGMYNALEKLRAGATLTAKDKTIHTQGLVSLLRELHDNLDRAVFAAYGWDDEEFHPESLTALASASRTGSARHSGSSRSGRGRARPSSDSPWVIIGEGSTGVGRIHSAPTAPAALQDMRSRDAYSRNPSHPDRSPRTTTSTRCSRWSSTSGILGSSCSTPSRVIRVPPSVSTRCATAMW
jgi:hypothetical protein